MGVNAERRARRRVSENPRDRGNVHAGGEHPGCRRMAQVVQRRLHLRELARPSKSLCCEIRRDRAAERVLKDVTAIGVA